MGAFQTVFFFVWEEGEEVEAGLLFDVTNGCGKGVERREGFACVGQDERVCGVVVIEGGEDHLEEVCGDSDSIRTDELWLTRGGIKNGPGDDRERGSGLDHELADGAFELRPAPEVEGGVLRRGIGQEESRTVGFR